MRKTQQGLSMGVLIGGCVVFALVALIGMKVAPAYIEYGQIRKAVTAIGVASGTGATVNDLRKAFDKRALVDDITTITGNDLDISKDGGDIIVSFAYPRRIPLFSNISLLIEFSGSSK
jgi:hypothetical protein